MCLLFAGMETPCQVINEFMAANEHFIPDESNEFEDWVELYNNTSEPIDIAGYFLTDDFSNPTSGRFPTILQHLPLSSREAIC